MYQGEKTSPLTSTLKGLNNKPPHEPLHPNPVSNRLLHKKPGQSPYQKETRTLVQWGILKNNNCHRYRINSIEEHLHSVTQLLTLMAAETGKGQCLTLPVRLSINIQPLPGLW